jgi:outer membrane immunogenic protein
MRNFNLLISAAVAAGTILCVGAASAADLPARTYSKAPVVPTEVAYDWSGFYVGGQLGYLWGKTRVLDDGVLTESGAPTNGVAGGLLAGYNWQRGPLVFGLEADVSWLNAVGHGFAPPVVVVPPPPLPNTYKINWDSHFVGKVGFASGHWLFFATGGAALAGFNFQEGVSPGVTPPPGIGATMVGFSLGGGIEYAFTQNLLARLQYIYDDFGGHNFSALDGGVYHINLTSQTFRGALSWKWNP